MHHLSKINVPLLLLLAGLQWSTPFAYADSPYLLQGIKEYYAGDYMNAAGHFGEAESSDFNDPKLHYYLGNTFVHLNQKEAAIREYRITFAIDPTGEAGTRAKSALVLCGAEKEVATPDKGATTAANAAKNIPDDPRLKEALTRLQQATDNMKQSTSTSSQAQAAGIAKLSDDQAELMKKHTQDMIDDLRHLRHGGPLMDEVRNEALAKQQTMQRFYDSQKTDALSIGRRRANAIDESASNLQQLLNEPQKPGHVKLSPAGTNLYVRNYEVAAPDDKQAKPAPSR